MHRLVWGVYPLAAATALLIALFASLYELIPLYAAYRLLQYGARTPRTQWQLGMILSGLVIFGFFLRGIVFLCMVALVLGYLLPQIRSLFTHRSARSLWAGLLFPVVSFPALWFAAAGGFESFIDYLVHYPYLFLSSGSAALYPQNIPWMIPFGGLGLVTLPFVALKHHTLPQKFALMGLLAVLFKYAFTREAPAHLQPLLVTILALGAYLGLQNNRFGMGYAAVLALLFGVQSYFSFGLWMPKTLAVNPIHWRPSKTPLLEPKVARIHDLPDNWRGKIENAICDSYPYDFLYQAAHGLTPEWRWVPQSYVNPHPALDRYTASQWEFHGAPFLLWHSAGTNGRNPQRFVSLNGQYLPNVEPCVFRTLVHQYAPRESHPDVLLLERITAPKTPEERLVETRTIHLNETIDLDPTVHQIRFFLRLTERGKLRSALYKEPPLFIEYHLADGMRFRYRLNRHQTPQGVWINPYFDHPNHTGRPVTGIQIQTAQPNAYARAVELSIFTYPWPPELLERWPFLKEASD